LGGSRKYLYPSHEISAEIPGENKAHLSKQELLFEEWGKE